MTRVVLKSTLRRGGRPSREEAGKLEDKILDAAAALFFEHGYGAVSIEKIAQQAAISKRTFYVRFSDKADLFRAVVHRVVHRLRPDHAATEQLFAGADLRETLHRIAPLIAKAALSPEGLALHRVVLAEATRFPELAMIMHEQSARREAIHRIAELLEREAKRDKRMLLDTNFLAEQFLFMITAAPQRHALGLGTAMKPGEISAWVKNSVDLFLQGCLA